MRLSSTRVESAGLLALFTAVLSCSQGNGATSATTGASSSHATGTSASVGTGGASATSTTSSSGSTGVSSGGAGGSLPMGVRVRVVAANLTSGNLQSYDDGSGARILQGIGGDILLMQEFNVGTDTPPDFDSLVESICGMDCTYVRGPTAEIPNGIVTRYPIVDSGSWVDALVTNRSFVWARLDVPGPIDCWAISVHLLTSNPDARATEGAALLSAINGVISPGDFVVIGGDFNTKVRNEPVLTALDPLFSVEGPFPVDQNGNDATSSTRTRPYDWVLADDALRAREIPVVIGQTTFASGAVIDTRVYQPIGELAPALVTDSGAPNMQHMAVVKDFALQ